MSTRITEHGSSTKRRMQQALHEAVGKAATSPGAQLPNGATILMIKEVEKRDHTIEFIVLAVITGFQPYVTWRYALGIGQCADGKTFKPIEAFCYSGSYHTDLEEAIEEYHDLER